MTLKIRPCIYLPTFILTFFTSQKEIFTVFITMVSDEQTHRSLNKTKIPK